jgi:hypothetical protein
MSDLNMQLVREFFELNRFYVLPHWRCEDVSPSTESASLLFVERAQTESGLEPEFLLRPMDLGGIRRAVVEVRAWHADRIYPSTIEGSPVLGHVASQEIRELGEAVFGVPEFKTILVVSEFSAAPAVRARALQMLQDFGIGHVLEFPTLLGDLLDGVSVNGNYAPSQTLQTLRLMKRYGFVRRQQMELFFPAAGAPEPAPRAGRARTREDAADGAGEDDGPVFG